MKNSISKLVSIAAAAILASTVSAAVIDFEDVDTSSWGGNKYSPSPDSGSLGSTDYNWEAGNYMANLSYTVTVSEYEGTRYTSWLGFKASQVTDKTYNGYLNDCASNTGSGANGSATYGILYSQCNTSRGTDPQQILFSDAINLNSIDLCNTLYTQHSMTVGDGFSDSFEDIDGEIYFNLRLRGIDINGNYSDYLDISLGAKDAEGNVTTLGNGDWMTVALDKLNLEGGLYGLEFSFEGSENICGSGYLNVPVYVAFDNINYSLAVPEPAEWAAIFGAIALGFAAYRRRK